MKLRRICLVASLSAADDFISPRELTVDLRKVYSRCRGKSDDPPAGVRSRQNDYDTRVLNVLLIRNFRINPDPLWQSLEHSGTQGVSLTIRIVTTAYTTLKRLV